MKKKKHWLLWIGLTISAVGFIIPIPGPADDPVDYLGYALTIVGGLQAILSGISRIVGAIGKANNK